MRQDGGLPAFLDFIDQIDAAVRQLDDLRDHGDVVAAAPAIDFDDALHIRLNDRARQGAAFFRLDLELELLVLDPGVALERDPVDDRIFHDRDNDSPTRLPNVDLLEQPGPEERLVGFVDLVGAQPAARAGPEIGADGGGFDPPIPLDIDIGGSLRIGARRRQDDGGRPEHTAEDQPDRA